MLVTMKEILDAAVAGNYAVPAINIYTEMDARPVLAAAEELNSPMILAVNYYHNPDIRFLGSYLTRLAEQAKVPVAIHLDHAVEFGQIMEAIAGGFTSVMYDCSVLPFEENAARVKDVVHICKPLNITVEAELGHVGMGTDAAADVEAGLTRPEEAKAFVEETGVDCLAVAIGTAHGTYSGTPHLDFERLAKLKEILGADFPLVLHGGSGTGDEALRKVSHMGINKINIATDISRAAANSVKDHDFKGNYYGIYDVMKAAIKAKSAEMIRLFGSEGKA